MLDLNDRLGRPRAEESATRFRALLRRDSIAVPSTFHLETPTFYGSSGRSRIDFVATPPVSAILTHLRQFFFCRTAAPADSLYRPTGSHAAYTGPGD